MRGKFAKKLRAAAVVAVIAAICGGNVSVYAATYKDVPETYWAYSMIEAVTDKGYMTGDSSGYFNPNDFMDKFTAAAILASAAGYKTSGATAAEQTAYNNAYDMFKDYIGQFVARYPKWDSTVNMQIAYLMNKGVFVREDLLQFFKFVDNQDKLVALTKEQACVFMVRLIGKSIDAILANIPASSQFLDDSQISADCRPFVYYLKAAGVISGDSTGPNSSFYPGNGITKAAFAVMLYKTLALANGQSTAPSAAQTTAQGVISSVYASFRAISMQSSDPAYDNKIYPVSQTASVTINGAAKTFADLAAGMSFSCVISGGEITTIAAVSQTVSNNTSNGAAAPAANPDLLSYEGVVSSKTTDSTGSYIEIEIKFISPKGVIYSDKRTYLIAAGCAITKDNKTAAYADITVGDIASLQVSGSSAYTITLEDKDRQISGTITGKKTNALTGADVIVVADNNNVSYELTVTAQSILKRDSQTVAGAADFRIGDSVDVSCEYDNIISIYAYGFKQVIDVTITEISITADGSTITVTDAYGAAAEYPLIRETADVYSLRPGDMVRLRLDSSEVDTVTLLSRPAANYVTGYIYSVGSSWVVISDAAGSSYNQATYSFDSYTSFKDSASGSDVTSQSLRAGMKIYIALGKTALNYANTITILN